MKDSFDSMDASSPIDEELLRYALDGDPLSDEVKGSIEHDQNRQRRLTQLMRVQKALTEKLYRSICPPAHRLAEYCAPMSYNIFTPEERMELAQHISTCPLCTAEVTAIRHEFATNNVFAEEQIAPSALSVPQALMRRIIAVLQPAHPQFVTRDGSIIGKNGTSGTLGWPRHYKAETLDLSLHLSHASNGALMLLGLFTSTDPDESIDAFDGSPAELYDASNPQQSREQILAQPSLLHTTVDDLGNLVFKSVPIGTYTLLVHLPEREVVIENIDVSRE